MKNWTLLLAALSLGSTSMLVEGEATSPGIRQERIFASEENEPIGREAVAKIRMEYESGQFDSFLQEMGELYQAALQNGEVELLGAMRPGQSPKLKKWEGEEREWELNRNRDLLALVQAQEMSPFVEKVASAATNPDCAAAEFLARFRQMLPKTGMTLEENLLIDIDLEYEYQSLQLEKLDLSPLEDRVMQCVLKMDRLEAMKSASLQFQDAELQEMVAIYAAGFDERLASSWDMADLKALANGQKEPKDPLEEQVASLLIQHQDKLSDLIKKNIEGER